MNIRDVIIFVAGVGVGAAGMFFGVKKHFDNRAAEEISEMREFTRNKIREIQHEKSDENKEKDPPEKMVYEHLAHRYQGEREDTLETSHPVDSDEDEDIDLAGMTEEERINYLDGLEATRRANSNDPPKIIELDDFGTNPNYNKVSLLYYIDEDILVEEGVPVEKGGGIIDDPEILLGDALTRYDFNIDDSEELCVRVESTYTDYIITKVWGPYEGR